MFHVCFWSLSSIKGGSCTITLYPQLILNDGRAKVNTQDTDGWTALMWACEYRYQEVVKQLLQKGADTYLRDRSVIPTLETGQ